MKLVLSVEDTLFQIEPVTIRGVSTFIEAKWDSRSGDFSLKADHRGSSSIQQSPFMTFPAGHAYCIFGAQESGSTSASTNR